MIKSCPQPGRSSFHKEEGVKISSSGLLHVTLAGTTDPSPCRALRGPVPPDPPVTGRSEGPHCLSLPEPVQQRLGVLPAAGPHRNPLCTPIAAAFIG